MGGGRRVIKKTNRKGGKWTNKKKKTDKKAIKENELKIKVTHELLAFTLSYLILAPCDTSIFQISLYALLPCQSLGVFAPCSLSVKI
jgi:hypothetical protein